MEESKTFTLAEAHLYFAKTLNGKVWELLEKENRTIADDELMTHAAHASCLHWLEAGTVVNHQRGEWLIAHVYTVLGKTDAALEHARRCFALTEGHADQMQDFDRAYAFESLARANALAGNHDEALTFFNLAEEAGQAIQEDGEKKYFLLDFSGGNWHGLI